MFVLPPIVAMVAFVYIRPQEVYEAMRAVTFPMLLAFALLGYVLDVRTGLSRPPRMSVFLAFCICFFGWALVTVGVNEPDQLVDSVNYFAGPVGLMVFISQGVQTIRAFRFVSRAFLIVTVVLAAIAVHQGTTPTVCLIDEGGDRAAPPEGGEEALVPCKVRADCSEAINPDMDWFCEHLGLMNTTSVEGRIRYRGIFQDPNELAFALSLSLPFAFGWFDSRRGKKHAWVGPVVVGVVLALFIACNVMTRSRSGQISLIATLGIYFLRRFGWRGGAVAAVFALPIMLLGGRDAESSTEERLEAWAEALSLARDRPFLGHGARMFSHHYYLTAHNSVLLALADMGPIGLLLFTMVIYMAFKMTLQVQRDFAGQPEAEPVRAAAFAVLAGLIGLVSSALFLSLTYHAALWIQVGLTGAVQSVVWQHAPDWRLRWRWRDLVFVVLIDVGLVVFINLYLHSKGL